MTNANALEPTHEPRPLLTPAEADRLLRYPRGRSARLARRGLLPAVELPDGELRFPADLVERLARHAPGGDGRGVIMRLVGGDDADGGAAAEGGVDAR